MYLGVPVPFGVWDYCTQAFVTKPGDYTVYVGTSADDTPHTEPLTVG
jgi:beta-glucosidase